MSFNWVPTGYLKSWDFTIGLNRPFCRILNMKEERISMITSLEEGRQRAISRTLNINYKL